MLRIKLFLAAALVFLSAETGSLRSGQGRFILFEVKPDTGQRVFVQWRTAAAMDSLRFEVERSRDKTSWIKITDVPSGRLHFYSSIDTTAEEGLNYYRVRQIANGGQTTVSEIKWVQIDKKGKLYLWPNPATSVLHIKTPFVTGSIDIYDGGGRFISKQSINNFITDVATGRLSKGIYFLHIKHDKETFTERFVKD